MFRNKIAFGFGFGLNVVSKLNLGIRNKVSRNNFMSKIKIQNFFSINSNNKITTNNSNKSKSNFYSYRLNTKHFSAVDEEGVHSDFQPKVKTEINNDNVMNVIDDWVKNNDVVLFMKGTRESPKCGFSNYVVQLLNFYKIKNVKVINILENPLLRESVKKYSNWPTYPQLYVKGSLVGGCDIIKEMHANGSFKELVEREGIAEQINN